MTSIDDVPRNSKVITHIFFLLISFSIFNGLVLANSPTSNSRLSGDIDKIIAKMSVEEKVGQVFMPPFKATFYNTKDEQFQEISKQVRDFHVGGLCLSSGDPYSAALNIKRFQKMADLPLLISADFEWGTPMRLNRGTRFPENMGIAATGNDNHAFEAGRITAFEARALGVHITFSPVLDVNNNPDNPIINNRSYGDNPHIVSEMGTAYIQGVQSARVAACAKHYPGHGDTDQDSHMLLPTINVSKARLDSLELVPFSSAIRSGVKTVMVGHIAFTSNQSGNTPATLSPYFLKHVLRDSLGFDGVIITDALRMAGIVNEYWPGESAVRALNAGADILLMPSGFELAYNTVVEAVQNGRISMERLNNAVRHILELKKWAGVDERRFPNVELLDEELANPKNIAKAERMFSESITLVKDSLNSVPLDAGSIDSMVSIIVTDDNSGGFPGNMFLEEIDNRIDNNRAFLISPQTSDSIYIEMEKCVERSDAVVLGVFVRYSTKKGTISLPQHQINWLRKILKANNKIITVGFGTPYLLRFIPEVPTYLVTFSTSEPSQRAVVRSIFGEEPITGKLPIALSNKFETSHGLNRDIYSNQWKYGVHPELSKKLVDLVKRGIADSVAPGMAFYIAQNDKVLVTEGVGHFTYGLDSPEVTRNTVFDLASLTKVIGTTSLAMKMYEQNLLHLNKPVSSYIPEFTGGRKDSVLIKHLLTHTSGLPWIRLYEVAEEPSKVTEVISQSDLIFDPGDSTVYSDMNLILLGIIVEKLGQSTLGDLSQKLIFQPLGMSSTQFNPAGNIPEQIAPTEFDKHYRHRQIQGEVHDENASFMGGVAGHAGLFSNIEDLGKIAQMYLSNGYYNGYKIFRQGTICKFTEKQIVDRNSMRALGWDKPNYTDRNFGKYFSSEAFCHTGFTGTSIVIDPKFDVIIILLTNRVYPTRDNLGITEFRKAFHDTIMQSVLTLEELRSANEHK